MESLFNQNRLLTVKEVAKILNSSTSTIYKRVHEGQIPSVKLWVGVSTRVRFDPTVMNKWLEERSREVEVFDRSKVDISISPKRSGKEKVKEFNQYVDELREAM